MTSPSRSELRAHYKARRDAVTPAVAVRFQHVLAAAVAATRAFRAATDIGVYVPIASEASPLSVVELARRHGKTVHLPVIDRPARGDLRFAAWARDSELTENRYGIAEPVAAADELLEPLELDLLLVPLVAFDRFGNRLGYGGGYYDRGLAGRQPRSRPILLGVAYAAQEAPALQREAWDVPLDGVVTELGLQLAESPAG